MDQYVNICSTVKNNNLQIFGTACSPCNTRSPLSVVPAHIDKMFALCIVRIKCSHRSGLCSASDENNSPSSSVLSPTCSKVIRRKKKTSALREERTHRFFPKVKKYYIISIIYVQDFRRQQQTQSSSSYADILKCLLFRHRYYGVDCRCVRRTLAKVKTPPPHDLHKDFPCIVPCCNACCT